MTICVVSVSFLSREAEKGVGPQGQSSVRSGLYQSRWDVFKNIFNKNNYFTGGEGGDVVGTECQ